MLEDAPEIIWEFHEKHPLAIHTIKPHPIVLSVKCLSSKATLLSEHFFSFSFTLYYTGIEP